MASSVGVHVSYVGAHFPLKRRVGGANVSLFVPPPLLFTILKARKNEDG